MFIVLEGADGAGKSSLATEIIRQFEELRAREGRTATVNLQHIGPPKHKRDDQSLQDYADQERERLLSMVTCYDPHDPDLIYVYDRFHGGSPAYGPLYRPGANLDEEFGQLGRAYFEEIEHNLHVRGAITSYLLPDVDVLYERTVTRADDSDEFLDAAMPGTVDAVRQARLEAADAQRAYADALADPEVTLKAKMAASHRVSTAFDVLSEAISAARQGRRQQLEDIHTRYARLVTVHKDSMPSYIGHGIYAQHSLGVWPGIAFNQDQFLVANYLLHKGLIAQVRATHKLRTGATMVPAPTPVVDCWGAAVDLDTQTGFGVGLTA